MRHRGLPGTPPPMLAQQIIASKRDGGRLSKAQIDAFVLGLVDAAAPGGWSDAQAGAMAMAILLRGMDGSETVALTTAMTRSGEVLDWSGAGLQGPLLDKHSTGGVGDKVSLLLAPTVAACGGVVPMVSGRGLGHTGGTLDKLEALPGYDVNPGRERLNGVLRTAGCAIVGASDRVAPADRRLYAIRDLTATVESLPLITASILSKKCAAGLQALVLDVKVGSGAFMQELSAARALAASLVQVARGAGLPAAALITDMNQVLGHTAGNALEVQEAIDFLVGRAQQPRLLKVTLALCGSLLHLGGLANTPADGERRAAAALRSGAAAEHFARMVAALGGPKDVLTAPHLAAAPVQRDVPAPHEGYLATIDARALGIAVITLGGGRRRNGDSIDPRVGLARVLPLGTRVGAGQALARVHAASAADAEAVVQTLTDAMQIADTAPAATPAIVEVFSG